MKRLIVPVLLCALLLTACTGRHFVEPMACVDPFIATCGDGLYAKSMGGGSVNPVTGEFNFAVQEGYMIRGGKIAEPGRGASLVGKGSDVIQKIDMVGTDLELGQGMCGSSSGSVPGNVGQPLIRVSSITVGGR